MDKKKKIMAGAGAAVIILAGAAFFPYREGRKGGQGSPGGMGGPDGMMQESTGNGGECGKSDYGRCFRNLHLTGTVEAADVVYVYAKAGGDVTAVNVKAGDMVSQGQVLMEINTEQVESAKEQHGFRPGQSVPGPEQLEQNADPL